MEANCRYIITEYSYDKRINYIFSEYWIARKIYDLYYNINIPNIDYELRKDVLSAKFFRENIEPGLNGDLYISEIIEENHMAEITSNCEDIDDICIYGHWSPEYRSLIINKESSLSKMKYIDYLKSNYWKKLRKERLEIDNNKCANCGDSKDLEIHHKTYIFRGAGFDKEIGNIITLCRECHRDEHKKINELNYLL